MKVTNELANFAVAPVAAEAALAMMRLSLFDWAACAIAGRDEPVARIVRDMVLAEAGAGVATVIGGGRAPARGAALAGGTASHALDYDDTHFDHIGHPSVAVIPAALAVAEQTGVDGAAFLEASLVGAELSIRLGVWLGRAHYQTGFHQTATAGAFGATAAAGRLLRLSADRMAHGLGLAATRAAGLKSQFGTMGNPCNAGIAPATGVEAALLAHAGFVSNPEALETEQGFGPTHAGEANAVALDGLGRSWRFETVSHKFHACCHGTHAAIEAIGALRGRFDAATVEAVTITVHPRWLRVCNIARPETGLQAKFSYRLTAAMALSGWNTAALESFSDAACRNPILSRLAGKIEVRTRPGLPETAAEVTVRTPGRTVSEYHDLDAPMPMARRASRLAAKAQSLLGAEAAGALSEATRGDVDLVALCALLGAASRPG